MEQRPARTRKDILASEQEAAKDVAESVKDEVMAFMTRPSEEVAKFMITLRKDGRPHSRPVSVFVEGWSFGTISQGEHLKNTHIRNNPIVAYQFVELHPEAGKPLKSVWVQGTCEVISDMDVILDFYKRREATIGKPDGHPEEDWERLLLKTTPTLVRAEGFLEVNKPALYRFDTEI